MNILHVVAAVVCIIFVSSLVLIPFAKADWTMFRADPTHSGAGTGNPALPPALLWNYTTGGAVVSSPAVVDGVIYVSSTDGNIYALNAANGIKIWSYAVGVGLSSPAVVGGVVYVGGGNNIYALRTLILVLNSGIMLQATKLHRLLL